MYLAGVEVSSRRKIISNSRIGEYWLETYWVRQTSFQHTNVNGKQANRKHGRNSLLNPVTPTYKAEHTMPHKATANTQIHTHTHISLPLFILGANPYWCITCLVIRHPAFDWCARADTKHTHTQPTWMYIVRTRHIDVRRARFNWHNWYTLLVSLYPRKHIDTHHTHALYRRIARIYSHMRHDARRLVICRANEYHGPMYAMCRTSIVHSLEYDIVPSRALIHTVSWGTLRICRTRTESTLLHIQYIGICMHAGDYTYVRTMSISAAVVMTLALAATTTAADGEWSARYPPLSHSLTHLHEHTRRIQTNLHRQTPSVCVRSASTGILLVVQHNV